MMKGPEDGAENWKRFFTDPPYHQDELNEVAPVVQESLKKALDSLYSNGIDNFIAQKRKQDVEREVNCKKLNEDPASDDSLLVMDNPRSYQTALFERAKKENIIVHLGTGQGKTLIALLLIRHLESAFTENKQTLFLVPSVVLALQQTATLKANLPYTVETACNATVHSEKSRKSLSEANIIVATHGACLDLLMHFGDYFSMNKFNLIILDECHHCTGNSNYALIMRDYYHKTPKESRPRILGLTASPLIKVRRHHSRKQLAEQLHQLESLVGATIASPAQRGLSIDDHENSNTTSEGDLLWKQAEERIVEFQYEEPSELFPQDHHNHERIHASRRKEFSQLEYVYNELGPFVLIKYSRSLAEDLRRNSYEGESPEQFQNAYKYFENISIFCNEATQRHKKAGRSDKLLALEAFLEDETHHSGSTAVGVVFVQRRITALVLKQYFDMKRIAILNKDDWPYARSLRSISAHGYEAKAFAGTTRNSPNLQDAQFMDAEIDDSSSLDKYENGCDGQFSDAEDDFSSESIIRKTLSSSTNTHDNKSDQVLGHVGDAVRCGVLVRKTSGILNRRGAKHEKVDEELINVTWSQHEADIHAVLNGLKGGEINVLIATSVVEEGVDVQACSFVAAFDSLQTLKGYIQMKGRARQEDAKFVVFHAKNSPRPPSLLLTDAKEKEREVINFLASCRPPSKSDLEANSEVSGFRGQVISNDLTEMKALELGHYEASHGTVSLRTAKSLLYRAALLQPIDSSIRSSKEALAAHLPVYNEFCTSLTLPAYISAEDNRFICLPEKFEICTKRERQNILALIACVRLHKLGLLNERLLPISSGDIRDRLFDLLRPRILQPMVRRNWLVESEGSHLVRVYRYKQTGVGLMQASLVCSGPANLAVVSMKPVNGQPVCVFEHPEFGYINCSLESEVVASCTTEELKLVEEFSTALLVSRWCRRRQPNTLPTGSDTSDCLHCHPFLIGSVTHDGLLDWATMKSVVHDFHRSADERANAVRRFEVGKEITTPRIISPTYNQMAQYIAYASSGQICSSIFPHEGEQTYKEYFQNTYGVDLDGNSFLLDAYRMWQLKSRPREIQSSNMTPQHDSSEQTLQTPRTLQLVKLPQDLCVEAPLADPSIFLEALVLPQYLYRLEQKVNLSSFLEHCAANYPLLSSCLTKISEDKILEALMARSCLDKRNYDRLEWLGDAVLKLVQTDVILKSSDLGKWIQNLHEGHLDAIRSKMSSNRHLEEVCGRLGFNRFVLRSPLARRQFTPIAMQRHFFGRCHDDLPRGKVCADVIEAILGLVYLECGYKSAVTVADELQLTIPWNENNHYPQRASSANKNLVDIAETFTGHKFRTTCVVEEAFSHSTSLDPNIPSYEKLEWIGDAVLCLAVREWLYHQYPDETVGTLVLMETPLIANETLAYLSFTTGLHKYLRYRDPTLPGRIEDYLFSATKVGSGLWGTEPPKVMADLVESLLGAVHVEGGFQEGQNAAKCIMSEIFAAHKLSGASGAFLCHPKHELRQLTGNIMSLSATSEAEFAIKCSAAHIWSGDQWCLADRDGHGTVASIAFLGADVFALRDRTSSAAVNRAAALMLAAIRLHEGLFIRIKDARAMLERSRGDEPEGESE